MNVSQVNLKYYSSTPSPSSDGDLALSNGPSSTKGFGGSGAGLYRRQGSTWVHVG